MSVRQIELHILPGDPGYGEPFLRLHLYTWAFITFAIVMIYVGVMLALMPRGIPHAPAEGTVGRKISTAIVVVFIGVVAANVIAIIFLEGFAPVLPDDPDSYTLIDQIRAADPSRRRRARMGETARPRPTRRAAGSGRPGAAT